MAAAYQHVLVATLGGQPQIVTFTLDLLLQKGYPISEVIVIHPSDVSQERVQRAVHRLNAEFMAGYYHKTKRVIHFHSYGLEMDGEPIRDIVSDEHAEGTLNTMHRLLGDLKRKGYRIHLSVSGGRRLISLLSVAVAALNFDHHDRIWHIYTPEEVQEQADEGKVMHVPVDAGVRLIRGPFLALGAFMYPQTLSFSSAQEEQQQQIDAQERVRCTEVVAQSTPAQLRVLYAFARGLKPQQIAYELGITVVTVNTHKTTLLRLCYNAWNMPDTERLTYYFLREKFRDYPQGDV